VEEKPVVRRPPPPFITSSLQQEANRKLGLSSRDTMQVAQKLYERGFITYMRTDSTTLSEEAIKAARASVKSLYGSDYLPSQPRDYSKKKAKGAQEAHEAIRPAGTSFVLPEETGLKGSLFDVYDLIWKRTVASQMADSQQRQVAVRLTAGQAEFAASGMILDFPGFLRAYVEGHDDPEAALDEREVRLPPMKSGDTVKCLKVSTADHETKPPARYTEASLVQKLEKEGIGRPSTYASIIGTVQDRGYVRKMGHALAPTFTALVVSNLLRQHLPDYVDLNFTAEMEKRLDDIADGDLDQKKYLRQVYFGDQGLKSQVEKKEKSIKPTESRAVELNGLGNLSFRVGRYGAYVCRTDKDGAEVCASIPDQVPPGDMTAELANKLIDQKISGADALGKDPQSGKSVYVLSGRYGPYVQLGEVGDDDADKPKRMALAPGMDPQKVSMEQALFLLSLPRRLGDHPQSGKPVALGIGRFGPYVVHDGDFRSVPKTNNLFEVTISDALAWLNQPKKQRGRVAPLKELGVHPRSKEPMQLFSGRYGPYIKAGKLNVSLPDDVEADKLTLAMAVELIDQKAGSAAKVAPKTNDAGSRRSPPKKKRA
jgi:DNA topoisomerase-1